MGRNGNELYGNLKYDDRTARVVGTAVTDYRVTGQNHGESRGTAKINGSSYTYTIDVTDGGAAKKGHLPPAIVNGYDTGVQHLTGSGRMTCGNIGSINPVNNRLR